MRNAGSLTESKFGLRFDTPFVLPLLGLALIFGAAIGALGFAVALLLIGAIAAVSFGLLRHDVSIAVLAVATALFVDWYPFPDVPIYRPDFAIVIGIAFLGATWWFQSAERRWVGSPNVWLCVLLLVLAAYPATRGVSLSDSGKYYVSVIGNTVVFYLVGVQIGRSETRTRRLLSLLSGLAALIAIHSIILELTGTFVFATPGLQSYLVSVGDFQLAFSTANRAGSFFMNPDWNGVYMAMMLFIAIGLLFGSRTLWQKVLYLVETLLILVGLLFTYSTASWISAAAGLFICALLVGRGRVRVYFVCLVGICAVCILIFFPSQLLLLLNRSSGTSGANSVNQRVDLWTGALHAISLQPLTGVGFGLNTYLARVGPLVHPHNSYLEIGAMAGLPVLLLFVVLLGRTLWSAMRTCKQVRGEYRAVLAGAIVSIVVLSINSMTINAWTLAPLATLGWLVLGAISSPGQMTSVRDVQRSARPPAILAADPLRHVERVPA